MTISRDAFLHSLRARSRAPLHGGGSEIRPVEAGQGWRIVLEPLPDLCLGAIRLARHRVAIHLAGRDEAATRRFLERFELYYRRGGG